MNRQLQTVLLFLSIFMFGSIKAQHVKVDSLENVLNRLGSEDTVKVNLLNKLALTIFTKHAEKALDYANKAAELSDKLNFKKGKSESFYVIGRSLSYYKSDTLALNYFLKALKIAEEIDYKPEFRNT